MEIHDQRSLAPGRGGARLAALAALVLVLAAAFATGSLVPRAHAAAGNASRAVGFVEAAQNADGGFGARKGGASDARATLWATVALLAAGKHPRDEFLKNGASAEQWLVAHRGAYGSLEELGLLALVQQTSGLGASAFGNPVAKLQARLSQSAVRSDPRGVAFAVFGLLAARDPAAKERARAAADALLQSTTSDGAWGPDGNADATSTAAVLQALAATGAAGSDTAQVRAALDYLKAAQVNDGAIAESTRVEKASAGGSVAATAYTIQALQALGLPAIRTATGKTPRDGLTQYQQQSSGGLTSKGGIYSQVAPSVVETAQAFPAFNGVSFLLPTVRATTAGPDAARRKAAADEARHDDSERRQSSGSGADGASGREASGGQADDPGAFERAVAGGGREGGRGGRATGDRAADERARSADGDRRATPAATAPAGGAQVSGDVVQAARGPALKTRAGADDSGLTNRQRATLAVGGLLGLLLLLGVGLERLRPRPAGARPLTTEALAGAQRAARPLLRGAARVGGLKARDGATGRRLVARRRWPLLLALAAGAALIALPFATKMFERAPQGGRMVDAFAPYMTAERIGAYQRDVREVDAYAREALDVAPAIFHPDVDDPGQRRRRFLADSPQIALFSQQWPAVHRSFTRLLDTIAANRGNYDAVAALPPFPLFPWFFVVPGTLLVVLALAGLLLGRRRPPAWIPLRRATVALGVGLVLAPVVFQMFTRAPQGGRMVDAFQTIQTRRTVQTVQGQFGTIAVGQGAIRTELVPKLTARGWSEARLRAELPATMRLQRRWTAILNAMTPMVGVMSDNVGTYRAVAALPPFALFPWLFVVPGLLAVAAALLAGRRPEPAARPPAPHDLEPDPDPESDQELACLDLDTSRTPAAQPSPSRSALPA
jgi:hypothetical protein